MLNIDFRRVTELRYLLLTAEFIIDFADKYPAFDAFKRALVKNGAEFSDSFITNLLRIIQHMKPVKITAQTSDTESNNQNPLSKKFPGLSIPNKKPVFSFDDESDNNKDKKKRITSKDIFKEMKISDNNVVDQAMAELESLVPSNSGPSKAVIEIENTEKKKRDKSRSRDRKTSGTKRRELSRDRMSRRSRSKDRHRSRDCHRTRSRERKRSRSKDWEVTDDFRKRNRSRSPGVQISNNLEPGKVSWKYT